MSHLFTLLSLVCFIIAIILNISHFHMILLMLLGVIIASLGLYFSKVNAKDWWIWGIELCILMGAAILIFGAKNIVGSGQQFSSKMAVASLRVMIWAQDQCVELIGRACTLEELTGKVKIPQIKADLLRRDFHNLSQTPIGMKTTYGLYHYQIHPNPMKDDPLHNDPTAWVAYAWPVREKSMPTFCINQNEDILIHEKRGGYVGDQMPAKEACLGAIDAIIQKSTQLNWDRDRLKKEEQKDSIQYPLGFIQALSAQGKDGQLWGLWRGKATRRAKSIHQAQ
jgi:hypothetical protein